MRKTLRLFHFLLRRNKMSTFFLVTGSLFIVVVLYRTQVVMNILAEEYSPLKSFNYQRNTPVDELDSAQVKWRHELVKDRCKRIGLWSDKGRETPTFRMSPVISIKHAPQVFYCPLAKAGSTFFTRYMMAMDKAGSITSPLDINITQAKRSFMPDYASLSPTDKKLQFLNQSYKFIFSRDPYSRIFSVYIDKLYSPNPYYWLQWGSKVVTANRLPVSEHPCGTGVSFPDFVKLVIKDLHKNDIHFLPMVKMCNVCHVDWNLVGKVEESFNDIDYLSRMLKVNSSFQHHIDYTMTSAIDVIRDSTFDSFHGWFNHIKKCISLYNMGRIIWRKLQIRGIIYNDIRFPFSAREMNSINAGTFEQACQKAAAASTDKSRLKWQKTAAFKEAFALVSQQDLETLKKIYRDDFFIFGYDPTPVSISRNRRAMSYWNILNWTVDWVG